MELAQKPLVQDDTLSDYGGAVKPLDLSPQKEEEEVEEEDEGQYDEMSMADYLLQQGVSLEQTREKESIARKQKLEETRQKVEQLRKEGKIKPSGKEAHGAPTSHLKCFNCKAEYDALESELMSCSKHSKCKDCKTKVFSNHCQLCTCQACDRDVSILVYKMILCDCGCQYHRTCAAEMEQKPKKHFCPYCVRNKAAYLRVNQEINGTQSLSSMTEEEQFIQTVNMEYTHRTMGWLESWAISLNIMYDPVFTRVQLENLFKNEYCTPQNFIKATGYNANKVINSDVDIAFLKKLGFTWEDLLSMDINENYLADSRFWNPRILRDIGCKGEELCKLGIGMDFLRSMGVSYQVLSTFEFDMSSLIEMGFSRTDVYKLKGKLDQWTSVPFNMTWDQFTIDLDFTPEEYMRYISRRNWSVSDIILAFGSTPQVTAFVDQVKEVLKLYDTTPVSPDNTQSKTVEYMEGTYRHKSRREQFWDRDTGVSDVADDIANMRDVDSVAPTSMAAWE